MKIDHSLFRLDRMIALRLTPDYDEREAKAIAACYLADRFKVNRTDILLDKTLSLTCEENDRLQEDIFRLERGEPLQYVLGHAEFDGHFFEVSPAVLIPRVETVGLVELAAARCSKGRACILDVGTGSGCIAASLALRLPDADITAWDISPDALAVARGNAASLGANIRFEQKDVIPLSEESCPPERPFDLIVSNPPYIRQREAADMDRHVVEHEPHTALFVPDYDPLVFYRALGRFGTTHLADGGVLCVETHRDYNRHVLELFELLGYDDVSASNDCFDAPRFVCGVMRRKSHHQQ